MHCRKTIARLSVFAITLFGSISTAWAGAPLPGVIVYAPTPAATSAPSLGQWALMLLVLLFAVVAYRALRERAHRRHLGQLLLGASVAAGGLAGVHIIENAQAVVPPTVVNLTTPGGGTANLIAGVSQVTNTSGIAQTITAVTPYSPYQVYNPTPNTPQCVVGTILPAGGVCYVYLAAPLA